MSVAAPVRTLIPGHSISDVDPPAAWAWASPPLAFDDVLKRSNADVLKRLLDPEPQPTRPSDRPNNAAILPARRMFFLFSLAAFFCALRQPNHCGSESTSSLRRAYSKWSCQTPLIHR